MNDNELRCQWCRKRVSAYIISTVYYGEKVYHSVCFEMLQRMARAVNGDL